MKSIPSSVFRIGLLMLLCGILSSCFKNDKFIKGDTKIRFYNNVIGLSQDFYLNTNRVSISTAYGSNTDYIITEGDKVYDLLAKNTATKITSDSLRQTLGIGKNYSVFYTKTSANDSTFLFLNDDLTVKPDSARLLFIDLGYTLGSKVYIRNKTLSFQKTITYGENSGYLTVPISANSDIYMNLTDSVNVIDTTLATNFYKGKVYTVLIDGSKIGKLQKRLIVNN